MNSIYTIAITGVNKDGSVPRYGERCPGIMAVTYSREFFSLLDNDVKVVSYTSTHPDMHVIAISNHDVIFTALGGEYKAGQNRYRELCVLPKFHSKAFLKIHEYPSAHDFEGKNRLHGV